MTSVPAATSATRKSRPQTNLTVLRREQLSPHMVRIVAGGPGFAGYVNNAFVDRYVKIVFPQPGISYPEPLDLWEIRDTMPRDQWPHTRTYTVRWVDEAAGELAIDFVIHGDEGLAGPWAASAQPGDALIFTGPGGGYNPDPAADWYLFAGDESALPAIGASIESLPAGRPRPGLPRGGRRRRHPGNRRAGRRANCAGCCAAAFRPAPATCWSPRCATPPGPRAGCRSLRTVSAAT